MAKNTQITGATVLDSSKKMEKSLFELPRMDCAAEANLVRLKLDDIEAVRSLSFDLSRRQLSILHQGELRRIHQALEELDLGSRLLGTSLSDETPHQAAQEQRTLLWAVLLINFAFFVLEAVFGAISGSMGLVADSLDMLADAIVYGLSLYAVGAVAARKNALVALSGYFQLALALAGLVEVLRRFLGQQILPEFGTMIIVSALALIANSASLYLLRRADSREAHMQASMIFTSNDVIINLGVIVAGLLVFWLDSGIPDLVVGAIVFIIVTRGALRILRLRTS